MPAETNFPETFTYESLTHVVQDLFLLEESERRRLYRASQQYDTFVSFYARDTLAAASILLEKFHKTRTDPLILEMAHLTVRLTAWRTAEAVARRKDI